MGDARSILSTISLSFSWLHTAVVCSPTLFSSHKVQVPEGWVLSNTSLLTNGVPRTAEQLNLVNAATRLSAPVSATEEVAQFSGPCSSPALEQENYLEIVLFGGSCHDRPAQQVSFSRAGVHGVGSFATGGFAESLSPCVIRFEASVAVLPVVCCMEGVGESLLSIRAARDMRWMSQAELVWVSGWTQW